MGNAEGADTPPGLIVVANALILDRSLTSIASEAGLRSQQVFVLLKDSGWQRLHSWERAVRALGVELTASGKQGQWKIPLTKVTQEGLDRSHDTLARRYAAAGKAMESNASMDGVISRTRASLKMPYDAGAITVPGLAAITKELSQRRGLLATHLGLIAGISDIACKRFVAGEEWTNFDHIHRLYTALGCTLTATAGELAITVAPHPLTPVVTNEEKGRTLVRAPGKKKVRKKARSTSRRSTITRDVIVEMLRDGMSQAQVAEKAKISRQRISVVASEEGLGGQRAKRQAENAKQGEKVLRKLRRN